MKTLAKHSGLAVGL